MSCYNKKEKYVKNTNTVRKSEEECTMDKYNIYDLFAKRMTRHLVMINATGDCEQFSNVSNMLDSVIYEVCFELTLENLQEEFEPIFIYHKETHSFIMKICMDFMQDYFEEHQTNEILDIVSKKLQDATKR